MAKVIDVIKRLLPEGTCASPPQDWEKCPPWPADLFAVTATLVKLSECYSRTLYTSPRSVKGGKELWFYDKRYLKQVKEFGAEWRRTGIHPPELQDLWEILLDSGPQEISHCESALGWWDAALLLMAISDEACAGIGFVPKPGRGRFADYYLFEYHLYKFYEKQSRKSRKMPYLPSSLCQMVPPQEVCIQPKTRTAQVGCTLRSLSHNLALLPSIGELKTIWELSGDPPKDEPLNLLIIPFPYRIEGRCFEGIKSNGSQFFTVKQNWLQKANLSSKALGQFIIDLIDHAKRELPKVHGVILPEGALDIKLAPKIANLLGKKTDLEIFISGTLSCSGSDSEFSKNQVYSSFLFGRAMIPWGQSKHHRWRLDRDQIRRYHLGHVLDPEAIWWERIDITDRQCHFYVFRHGASLATLICEDLARIDPVQTVLRSIGPNLVVALLMDGPQLERRWPGRYATVLADDPGSAVLTLTSLGMIRRSVMPAEEEPRQIALWKDSAGVAQELKLPKGSHALLLTLSITDEENFTMDGRSDDKNTLRLTLSGVRDVVHPDPPKWID